MRYLVIIACSMVIGAILGIFVASMGFNFFEKIDKKIEDWAYDRKRKRKTTNYQ